MTSHLQHRGGHGMVTADGFTVADVRLAGLHVPEHNGVVEGVAGSVTSFVRKLFQMVQGECDSVVGFVADGTAFEVKDPRRLEQDILPKYFRHSRFQSLVRQLNFYNFKKISKERSVWIYKHAFFRRDEPELLHALKRKTNQHGARIGDPNVEDEMMSPRVVIPRSLAHDRTNPRPPRTAGPGSPRNPTAFPIHPTSSSSFSRQQQPRLPQHIPQQQQQQQQQQQHGRVPERHVVAGTKLQSNSRSGGGPSTGGVGGAAAAPCYGRGGGPGPSLSARMPGFGSGGGGWSREAAGSGGGAPAGRSVGGAGVRGEDFDLYSDHRMHAAARAPSHSSASHLNPRSNNNNENNNERPQQAQLPTQQQPYRQGPAVGVSNGGDGGGGRGTKRDADGAAAMVGATTAAGANDGAFAPGSSNFGSSDRDQALALYGLSALCQVASATAAVGGDDGESRCQDTGACENRNSGFRDGRTQRLGGGGNGGDGGDCVGHEKKRACTGEKGAGSGVRRGGVWQRYNGDEHDGGGRESSEEDEDDVEDGITSAERDDSVTSSLHSRSGSICGDNNNEHYTSGSPPASPSASTTALALAVAGATTDRHDRRYPDNGGRGGGYRANGAGNDVATAAATLAARSGSTGVFCQTWDWGRAANQPTLPLRGTIDREGSFVDRRFEERMTVDKSVRDEVDFCEGDVEEHGERSTRGSREEYGDERCSTGAQERRQYQISSFEEGGANAHSIASPGRPPRDMETDAEAEAAVGLTGVGVLFDQFGRDRAAVSSKSKSIYLATAMNNGDEGLREMAVFCASSGAAAEPETASPTCLARQVSLFLENEEAVAQDLRVYAEALDPAAADIVSRCAGGGSGSGDDPQTPPTVSDRAKLLRIFCRYAACRLGRALEITSAIADCGPSKSVKQANVTIAQRVSPRLDECRWKWWRAAVRFS